MLCQSGYNLYICKWKPWCLHLRQDKVSEWCTLKALVRNLTNFKKQWPEKNESVNFLHLWIKIVMMPLCWMPVHVYLVVRRRMVHAQTMPQILVKRPMCQFATTGALLVREQIRILASTGLHLYWMVMSVELRSIQLALNLLGSISVRDNLKCIWYRWN